VDTPRCRRHPPLRDEEWTLREPSLPTEPPRVASGGITVRVISYLLFREGAGYADGSGPGRSGPRKRSANACAGRQWTYLERDQEAPETLAQLLDRVEAVVPMS
jgi:hypothetical protein